MCIIVVKDKNTPLPKEEYLKNCFDNNSDGAGFMYLHKNRVVIDKGYMTYKAFQKRYYKLRRKFNDFKDLPLIMHFRIGTSSSNSKENTHPYPISDDVRDLHATYIKTSLGVAHNGIIHEYNPQKHEKKVNDTQKFIMNYLYPLYKNWSTFYKNENILKGIELLSDSKFAFLDKYGTIKLVGKFETDEDGVKYSNSNYLNNWYYDLRNYYYRDYEYLPSTYSQKITKEPDYDTTCWLEANWYYSIKGGDLIEVGDKNMLYDFYEDTLYMENDLGEFEEVSEGVVIFDENGEEIIF